MKSPLPPTRHLRDVLHPVNDVVPLEQPLWIARPSCCGPHGPHLPPSVQLCAATWTQPSDNELLRLLVDRNNNAMLDRVGALDRFQDADGGHWKVGLRLELRVIWCILRDKRSSPDGNPHNVTHLDKEVATSQICRVLQSTFFADNSSAVIK